MYPKCLHAQLCTRLFRCCGFLVLLLSFRVLDQTGGGTRIIDQNLHHRTARSLEVQAWDYSNDHLGRGGELRPGCGNRKFGGYVSVVVSIR